MARFQHTAARRRLPPKCCSTAPQAYAVSTHSRAEAAAKRFARGSKTIYVSTHSRAEAAAGGKIIRCIYIGSFNTQPRGGGCESEGDYMRALRVSTHSRAEAAALWCLICVQDFAVSTHSRAEAAAAMALII